jgi:hypothetical protein
MNRRDTEKLSAYLDGELKSSDLTKLEARLKTDPELASVLNDIRAARTLLRNLPSRKATRNFTLTRKMVGQNPPLPRTYPVFRFATAVATLLFFFSIGVNSFGTQMASRNVAYGIGGSGGGGDSESLAAESPALDAPAAPPADAESELYSSAPVTEEPSADLAPQPAEVQPTDDALRTEELPSSKNGEAETATGAEQIRQEAPRIISTAWQLGLAIVALMSALLMGLMRQLSARRWK